jgi:hypothetical protein
MQVLFKGEGVDQRCGRSHITRVFDSFGRLGAVGETAIRLLKKLNKFY